MQAGHRAQKGLYKTCNPVTTTICLHWDDANCETRSKKRESLKAWDPKISTFWMPKLWTDNILRGCIFLFERVLESSFWLHPCCRIICVWYLGQVFPATVRLLCNNIRPACKPSLVHSAQTTNRNNSIHCVHVCLHILDIIQRCPDLCEVFRL